jgi:lipid-binding SYLF domain-containing protein
LGGATNSAAGRNRRTERGARSLLGSEFTLGGQVSVAAGPVGRTAEAATDIKLDAEVYSYARSRGLFAGLSLEGASLSAHKKAIKAFYGKELKTKQILIKRQVPKYPSSAKRFVGVLPG